MSRCAAKQQSDGTRNQSNAWSKVGFATKIGDARIARAGARGDAEVTYATGVGNAEITATTEANSAETQYAGKAATADNDWTEATGSANVQYATSAGNASLAQTMALNAADVLWTANLGASNVLRAVGLAQSVSSYQVGVGQDQASAAVAAHQQANTTQSNLAAQTAAARLAWLTTLAPQYVAHATGVAQADADYGNQLAMARAFASDTEAGADLAYSTATAPLEKQHAIDTTHAQTDHDKAAVGRENAWFDQLAPADKDEGVARAVAERKFAVSVETAEKGYQVGVASAEHLYQMMLGMGAGSSAELVRTAALAASEVIRSSLRRSADVTLAIDNADATLAWDVTMAGADRDWSSGDSTDYKNLRGSLASADHAYATSLIPHGTTRDLASMSATIDYWNKDLLAANTWNLSVAQSMADFRGADLAARATALSHLSLTLNSGPLPWMQFRADLAAQESAWWSGTATTPGFRATYLQWFANSNASRTAYQQTVNTLYTSLCGSQTAADATRSASLANAEQTAENGYAAKDDAYGQAMANATCCYVVTAAHAKRNYAVSLAMAAAFQTAPNTAAYSGQMASARQSYASAEVSSLSIWRTGTANVNLACVTDTSSAETSWVSSTAAARKGYAIGEATANATMRVGLAGHERTYREQEVGTYHTAMVALATANGSPWAQLAADEAFARYNYTLAIGQPWLDFRTALANADRDQEQAGAAAEEVLSNSRAAARTTSKLSAAQAALTRAAALNAADAALLSSGHYAPNLPANIVDSLFTASTFTDLTDLTDPPDPPDPSADGTFDYLIAHSFERSPQTGATLPSDDAAQYSYWRTSFAPSDHLRERLVRPKPPEVVLDQRPSAPPQLAAQAATGVSSTAETTAPGGSSTSGAKSSFGSFQEEVKTNGAANTNASTLTTTQFKNLQSTAPQVAAQVRPTQSPPGGGGGTTSGGEPSGGGTTEAGGEETGGAGDVTSDAPQDLVSLATAQVLGKRLLDSSKRVWDYTKDSWDALVDPTYSPVHRCWRWVWSDPSFGLPTDPEGEWSPQEFFTHSLFDWRRRGWGCGGMAAFRILGDEGESPLQVLAIPGARVYSNFADAVAALRDQRYGGAIMALQNKEPFTIDGIARTDVERNPVVGVDASRVGGAKGQDGNFAILLGVANDWYWEYANHGWSTGDLPTARIVHSRSLPSKNYTLYCVVPYGKTCTHSCPPSPGTFDSRGGYVANPPDLRKNLDRALQSIPHMSYPARPLW